MSARLLAFRWTEDRETVSKIEDLLHGLDTTQLDRVPQLVDFDIDRQLRAGANWPDTGVVLKAFTFAADVIRGSGPTDPERLLHIAVGGFDLLQREIPERASIIERIFRAGDLGFLIGEGGAGKSALGVQLAVARATGTDWIGFRVGHGRTGLLVLELDDHTWQRRIRAAATDPASEALNDISVICRPDLKGILALDTPAGMASLKAWIEGAGLSLVILDPLQRTHGLDENKAGEMAGLLQQLDALRADTGCAILISHHTRKSQPGLRESSRDAGSGSRVFRDFPSFHAHLERKSDGLRVLTFGKVSRAVEPPSVWLRMQENGVLAVTESPTSRGEQNRGRVLTALLKLGNDGARREAIVEATGLSDAAVKNHLVALETDSKARRSGQGKATLWWPGHAAASAEEAEP